MNINKHFYVLFFFLDFSGSAWMKNNDFTPPLSKYQSTKLMREIKASRYLMAESCSSSNEIYSHLKDGWNSCKCL